MELPEPFFLKNEKWYNYNVATMQYELTEEAPPEAVKSFKEYYEQWEALATDDIDIDIDFDLN